MKSNLSGRPDNTVPCILSKNASGINFTIRNC